MHRKITSVSKFSNLLKKILLETALHSEQNYLSFQKCRHPFFEKVFTMVLFRREKQNFSVFSILIWTGCTDHTDDKYKICFA
jgi:hypothetical protein